MRTARENAGFSMISLRVIDTRPDGPGLQGASMNSWVGSTRKTRARSRRGGEAREVMEARGYLTSFSCKKAEKVTTPCVLM
jgi:hypothetical protein